jgi:hypothetical protein
VRLLLDEIDVDSALRELERCLAPGETSSYNDDSHTGSPIAHG